MDHDYNPFGLTFNSYQRENSVDQKYKFQGQEHIDDLGLGWDSFKWRNHQPDIGRFFNVDPLSEKFYYNSPYAFSENKVTNHIELEGLEAVFAQVEGRVSIPLSSMLVGVTASAAIGIAVNIEDGKGMIYKTTSLGIQAGFYAGGGVEVGLLPTGSIENLKGLAVNAGASMTPALIAGVPFGPDFGGEINVTVPQNENEQLGKLNDARLGGTVDLNDRSRIFGPRAYVDFKLGKGFIAHVEGECMDTFVPSTLLGNPDNGNREWVWSVMTGIKKEYKIYKNLKGTALIQYNLFNRYYKAPYVDRLNSRIGFEYVLKKNKKRKHTGAKTVGPGEGKKP